MEERRAKKIKGKEKNSKGFKKYLEEFKYFFNKELKKKAIILAIIMIFIVMILSIPIIKEVIKEVNNSGKITNDITFWSLLKDKICIMFITILAGVVPYIYIPALSSAAYIYQIVVEFAYIIINKGYVLGVLFLLVPLCINIISIALAGASGIYLCKIDTAKFRIGQRRNVNFDNIRLSFYQTTGNKQKEKMMQNKIDEKEKKILEKDIKVKHIQLINVFAVCTILQVVSSLIEYILI